MKHLAVLALALAACGGSAKPVPSPTVAPTVAPTAAPAAEAPPDGIPVVLDAGAEPRYALRYHPEPEDRREMTMEMSFSFENGGASFFMPTMLMYSIHEIVAVDDDGTITARMTFGRPIARATPHHTPDQVAAVQVELDRLENVAMTMRYSAQGELLENRLDDGIPEDLRSNFDDMANGIAPLPIVPVGRGARWRTHVERSKQGMPIVMDIVNEVLEVDADHVRIRGTVTASGGGLGSRQRIRGTGSTETSIDLAAMAYEGWFDLDLEVDDRGDVTNAHTTMSFGMK